MTGKVTGKFLTHSARWLTWPEYRRHLVRSRRIERLGIVAALVLPTVAVILVLRIAGVAP